MFKDVVKHLNISAAEKEKVNIALSMSYAAGSQSLSLSNLLYCTDHNNETFFYYAIPAKKLASRQAASKVVSADAQSFTFFVVKVL